MQERAARIGYLAGLAGLGLLSAFGIILVALHMMAARHSAVPAYLSHFRLLPFAWLWLVALGVLAVGALLLTVAMHVALPPGPWTRAGLTFLYALVPMAVAVAVFPAAAPGAETDIRGRLHEGAAIAMFLSLGCAMVCLFATLRDWSPVVGWSSLALGIGVLGVTPWFLDGFHNASPDVAYSERIVVLLNGAWLMMLGVWSRFETAPFARRRRTRQARPMRTMGPAID